jgi:hypothetical protein
MPGYLDQYGVGVDRRIRIIKTVVISGVALIAAGLVLWYVFYNYPQERQAKHFFTLLEAHDYQGAYEMWVRTADERKSYPFQSFLRDWGPQGQHPNVTGYRIAKSRSCGSGVILTVDFPNSQEEKLWVQRDDLTIGFSPLPGCPAPR